MDRNVILGSNRQARIHDEGTEFVGNHARREGGFMLMCLMVLLMVYNLLKGIQGDDLVAVFWACTSVIYLHKYKIYYQKTDPAATMAVMVTALTNLLLHFLHTW